MRRGLGLPLRCSGARVRARGKASVVGLVLLAWSAGAEAAPFELAWSAPTGCPSRDAIVDATYAAIGESRSEASPELFVQGTVVPAPGGFVVTLALSDATGAAVGERVVRVDRSSCQEILKPASAVLAMMIAIARPRAAEGQTTAESSATPPTPAPPPPPPAARAPRAVRPRAVPGPSSEKYRLSIGAAGVASIGVLPDAAVGVGLRASYLPRSIALIALEASWEFGGTLRIAGGEVGFQLISAAGRAGLPILRTSRFELIPNVGARLGLIRTLPTGFAAARNDLRATWFIGVAMLLRARLGSSLFADVLVEGEHMLLRDRFQILQGGVVYPIFRPSPFDGRLSLGVAYEFL